MKKFLFASILLAVILIALGVFLQYRSHAQLDAQLRAVIGDHGLTPLSAPSAASAEKIALGRMLFFDKELSGNRDIACATCHQPALGTSDALALSIGTGGTGIGVERQIGEKRSFVPRNAQELFNRGLPFWETMFWDARVAGTPKDGYVTPAGDYLPQGLESVLAAQAMFPVLFRDEMRGGFYDIAGYQIQPGEVLDDENYTPQPAGWHDVDVLGGPNELAVYPDSPDQFPAIWDAIMDRLLAFPAYQELFQAAYPDTPPMELGFEHAANALAAFQATSFSLVDSPWDRYLAGDSGALSTAAKQGALLFYGDAGCSACHSGALLTDQGFHNIGAPQFGPGRDEFAPLDYGRYHATGLEADKFAFRTPTLRNVAVTGPWLHNGAYDSLADVILHHADPASALRGYDGGRLPEALRDSLQNSPATNEQILASLDPLLADGSSLSSGEIQQIIAFLESLTDPAIRGLEALTPDVVPSGLPVTQ